ncbi:hypothetical protein [Sphingobium fuliginis]|uniref:Peptidase n=1 Tax=Sphingobium fuliginis ATCC 27551 TaxID=1208342 RepID=A0A5B8CHG5_SPHSA|nr:hypothetical protein [Sphingobium fuliginis]QDC38823.1 hypothetical protein FIL70_17815 [Sphingobium fuliginis ATCC 27551]
MAWTGRRFLAAIGLAGALALGGCAYDDGYYGGVSVGSGYYGGGYYDDYWGPGYYRPGYYGGWYDGYYYPGSGYYVYNRSGHRQRWNDGQRRYWEGRREARRDDGRRGNWNNGAPRQGWRERSGGDGNRWNGNGRWNGNWRNARQGNPAAGAQAPGPGRGQGDMTTPRTERNWGPPRTRSDGGARSGGGGRSGREGWRGRRD